MRYKNLFEFYNYVRVEVNAVETMYVHCERHTRVTDTNTLTSIPARVTMSLEIIIFHVQSQ